MDESKQKKAEQYEIERGWLAKPGESEDERMKRMEAIEEAEANQNKQISSAVMTAVTKLLSLDSSEEVRRKKNSHT